MALTSGVVAIAQGSAPRHVMASAVEPEKYISTAWRDQNRYIELSVGQRNQKYQEADTYGLTNDGVLDTETGHQEHTSVSLRWQTTNNFLIQLQAQRQSGVTKYKGYLQSANGDLTPFRANTGSISTQFNAGLGYALNAKSWHAFPQNWQVTPIIEFGRNQWQRYLVQYSENYNFNSYSIGALVQWQARPGTILETKVWVGRTQSAGVSVPRLNFAATQPGSALHGLHIGISQSLGALTGKTTLNGWHIAAQYTITRYQHGASPLINGLQAPPNQNRLHVQTIGLRKQF